MRTRKDAWDALRTWYGGGPPLPRIAVSCIVQVPIEQHRVSLEDSSSSSSSSGGGGSGSDRGEFSPEEREAAATAAAAAAAALSTPVKSASVVKVMLDLWPQEVPNVLSALAAKAMVGGGTTSSPGTGSSTGGSEYGTRADVLGLGSVSKEGGRSPHLFNDCGKNKGHCFVCRANATSHCGICKAVYYCGKGCQQSHWKFHKLWCKKALEHKELPFDLFQKQVPVGRRGRVGLSNLGNSCYLNSCLQCLSHIKPLTKYFLSNRYSEETNKESLDGTRGVLVEEYAKVLRDLWFESKSCIYPRHFKKALGIIQPDWAGFQQHDSQEVVGFILDKLHEDQNRIKKKPYTEKIFGDGDPVKDAVIREQEWSKCGLRDDSIIKDIVGSFLSNRVTCTDCGFVSVSFDYQNTMCVQVPISTQRTLRILFLTTGKAPMELAVQVDRTMPYSGIKNTLAQLLPEDIKSSKSYTGTQLMELVELDHRESFVTRYVDDLRASDVKEVCSLIAFSSIPECKKVFFLLQRVMVSPDDAHSLIAPKKVAQMPTPPCPRLANLPIPLCLSENTTCWKLRMSVWKHVSRFIKKSSPLGLRIAQTEATGDNKAILALNIAIIEALPIRLVDQHGWGKSSSSVMAAVPFVSSSSSELLGDLGLDIHGGFAPNSKSGANVLGSLLPTDKNLTISEFTTHIFFSFDWSGAWLESIDEEAVKQIDRHQSAIVAFGTAKEVEAARKRAAAGAPPPQITLEQCLREFCKEEHDHEWRCGKCNEHKTNAKISKRLCTSHLPQVMILMLKRHSARNFDRIGGGSINFQEKISTYVDFPMEGLDLAPFCDVTTAPAGPSSGGGGSGEIEENEGDEEPLPLKTRQASDGTLYDLFAVLNHYGRMGFGHYTAYARDWLLGDKLSDVWLEFDDDDVTPCEGPQAVKSNAAYILFYRRRPSVY